MDNETYLNLLKNNYESLNSFYIQNNMLIFKDKDNYILPLRYISLYNLNPNIFLLKPRNIYRVIYLLELLPKKEISDNDKAFISAYIEKYLKLEDERLANNNEDELNIIALGIPVNLAYDPEFINNPASSIIQSIINNHDNELQSGRNNQPKLVLTNPNFVNIEEENPVDKIEYYSKAGFATFLLIAIAIVATCLYLIYFFSK